MLGDNKQIISDIENSNVQQARRDINNFIILGESTLGDIIHDVVRTELNIVTKEAYEQFNQILEEFKKHFTDELAKLKNLHDVINKFREPKYQFILHDTIKEYTQTNNEETKADLIDILIEGLQVDENSTEQFVIEEARYIVPRLSISSVHFLGTMLLRKVVYGNRPYILTTNLKEHAKMYNHLDKVTKLDIAFLQQLGCLDTMGLQYNITIEEEMKRKYDMYFRQSPNIEDYNALIVQYPEITSADLVHKDIDNQLCFHKISTKLYEEELKQKGMQTLIPPIKHFIDSYPLFTDEEIKDKLITINPLWENAIRLFADENVKSLKLSPVGAYIANRIVQKEKMHVPSATLKELF